jgi:hypothetical protein
MKIVQQFGWMFGIASVINACSNTVLFVRWFMVHSNLNIVSNCLSVICALIFIVWGCFYIKTKMFSKKPVVIEKPMSSEETILPIIAPISTERLEIPDFCNLFDDEVEYDVRNATIGQIIITRPGNSYSLAFYDFDDRVANRDKGQRESYIGLAVGKIENTKAEGYSLNNGMRKFLLAYNTVHPTGHFSERVRKLLNL